uniref:Uncharacterized protein n=1 Tax=Amphimedon queenslandica TaxID=400682 RepID=A0A1X7SY51_AMPQE
MFLLPIQYHDMDGVVDFLILESVYKTSIQTQWSNGSIFKSLIDNQYYTRTTFSTRHLKIVISLDYDIPELILVFQRWIDSNKGVTWRKVLQVCDDYPDDSKCHRDIHSVEDCQLLKSDLGLLCDWITKAVLLAITLRGLPVIFDYSLDGQPTAHQQICKDLGVVFSNTLSWSAQVDCVLKKAYNVLRMIKRVFPAATTPTVVKKKLYLSLVVPILTYCSPVWRPSLVKDFVLLEQLQRRATRSKYILFDYQSDYKSRLSSLKAITTF